MRTNILSALNELPDDEILKITDVIQDDLNMISTYELLPDLSTYSDVENHLLRT